MCIYIYIIYTAILECRPNHDTKHFDIVETLGACLGHFGTWLGHWWDICGTSVGHLCFDLALTWLGLGLDLSWTCLGLVLDLSWTCLGNFL